MADKVLVTGGTGSVGDAIVRTLRSKGFHVTFTYLRNAGRAINLEKETGATALQWSAGKPLAEATNVDVLVNNAGINVSRAFTARVQTAEWVETMNVNLWGALELIQACLPSMVSREKGKIINIGSIYGLRGCEGNLPYNASKHALHAVTKTVAMEYGRRGIICTEICPGPIKSELLVRIAAQKCGSNDQAIQEYLRSAAEEIPTGELVEPEEIAEAVLWMILQKGKALNGATLVMDGGLTL